MADPAYGHQPFPSTGPYLFSGQFLRTRFQRVFQGGLVGKDSITATSGGTQAAALQLAASFNNVTTVAADNDSVALPKAIQGSVVWIDNNGAHILGVYAKVGSGDTINGSSTSTQFSQAAAKRVQYICITSGKWLTSTAAIP